MTAAAPRRPWIDAAVLTAVFLALTATVWGALPDVLVALRVAQRPPDAEHPYGHSRAEGIAASNVALLIIVSAVAIGWEALQRIGVPHSLPPIWTLSIAASTVTTAPIFAKAIGRHVMTLMRPPD